jgi:hypothetical protein
MFYIFMTPLIWINQGKGDEIGDRRWEIGCPFGKPV